MEKAINTIKENFYFCRKEGFGLLIPQSICIFRGSTDGKILDLAYNYHNILLNSVMPVQLHSELKI